MQNNLQGKKKTLLLSRCLICFNMKYMRFIPVLLFFIGIFYSCSTDVDLYAEYKDVPIIYAMLNSRADTNYVKITRAFCGTNDNPINANDVALISDSSNYPGKLDVRFIELKSTYGNKYEPTGRVLILDTLTIHDKEEGVFYSPDQVVYYTPEHLNVGTDSERYSYRFVAVKPDGDTVAARTTMVGNEEFSIETRGVNFQRTPTNALGKLYFRADGIAPLYDVKIEFNYREQKAGQEMQMKKISRSFGTRTISEYTHLVGNTYYLEYSLNWLFNTLGNAIGGDTVVDANHPNVVRYIDDFIISISAGGDELNYYYLANQAQMDSPISLISVYTNIEGGYGLFSSRTTIKREAKLTSSCKRDLFSVSAWGFKED